MQDTADLYKPNKQLIDKWWVKERLWQVTRQAANEDKCHQRAYGSSHEVNNMGHEDEMD